MTGLDAGRKESGQAVRWRFWRCGYAHPHESAARRSEALPDVHDVATRELRSSLSALERVVRRLDYVGR